MTQADHATWEAKGALRRHGPTGGWPELSPNVYDLPEVRAVVQQLGDGAFSPSSPGGAPWHPVAPMIRAIFPSAADDPPWAAPADGHLDGYAGGWVCGPGIISGLPCAV